MATTANEPSVSLKEEACSDPPPASDDDVSVEDSYTVETVGTFLSEAESLKERGNVEFQKGRVLAKHTAGKNLISDACLLYAEGLRALASVDEGLAMLVGQEKEVEVVVVKESDAPSPHTRKDLEQTIQTTLSALSRRADSIRPSLYLNLAACNLLLHEGAAAIACCTHVLERCGDGIAAAVAFADGGGGELSDSLLPFEGREGETESESDSDSSRCRELAAKALYRRSTAREGGGDYVAAREDLVRALRLKPGDASIRRQLKKLDKKVADAEASEALRRETEDGRTRRQQQRKQQQEQQRQLQQHQQQQQQRGGQSSAPSSLQEGSPMEAKPEATTAAASSEGDAKKPSAGPKSSAPPADHAVADTKRTADSPDRIDGKEQEGRTGALDQRAQRKGGQGEGDEEPFPTGNGGECREGLYSWNQSIREVQVCVQVPDWAGASDLRVDIRRSRLSVAVLLRNAPGPEHPNTGGTSPSPTAAPASKGTGEPGVVAPAAASHGESRSVLEGVLARPVQVDECLWTTERRGSVVLYLQKELPADGEPGFEWWANVMEGDPEINTLECDAGSVASKYPEHARRRGAKAVWDDQQKSPEEKLKDQRMRDARRQMVEEAEERQRNLEEALKDPNKAKLYRQLQETMPDVPISMK